MTQPNQSELREQLIELDGELWDYQLDKLTAYITANYTPNTEIDLGVVPKPINRLVQEVKVPEYKLTDEIKQAIGEMRKIAEAKEATV